MPERIDRIIDDQIVGIMLCAQKAQSILVIDIDARIFQSAGVVREKLPAHIHECAVGFHDIDLLDLFIIGKFSRHTAVSATDNQHFFHMRMHRHRHMHNHLIVDELILFREDDTAVGA